MSKLTKLLEVCYADSTERKRILDRPSTGKLLGEKTIKTLLQSNAAQVTNLLQEEVYSKISEGAEPWQCMRQVVPVIKTDSYSVRVVKGETGTYADEVAEGANVPIDTQVYSKEDITINKIGTRPLITNELVEDCLWDIIDLELKKSGMRMENKLNRDIMLEILTDVTTADTDPAAATLAVGDLAISRGAVANENYMPDKVIFHPQAESQLLRDGNLVFANQSPVGGTTLQTGQMPKLLGMTPFMTSVTLGSTAKYWDATDAANHYMGLVLDSQASTYLAMRRDLTVEQYEDPIHDLVGISCTMRYGCGTIQPKSANAILTK